MSDDKLKEAVEQGAKHCEGRSHGVPIDAAICVECREPWPCPMSLILAAHREAQELLADLKTEAGKAAFAVANGWPLPEEILSLRSNVREQAEEIERLKAKHESGGAHLYAGLCQAIIGRILEGPDKWVDVPGDILLRLESYIRRAESLEQAEAKLAAAEAELARWQEMHKQEQADANALEKDVERLEKALIGIASAANCTSLESVRNAAREALRPAAPDKEADHD